MNETIARLLSVLNVEIRILLFLLKHESNVVDVALDFVDGRASGEANLDRVEERLPHMVIIDFRQQQFRV